MCLSWCMHSRTRSEDRCFEGWTHFAGSPSPGGYFHHKTVNVIRIDYKGLGKYGPSRQLQQIVREAWHPGRNMSDLDLGAAWITSEATNSKQPRIAL